MPKNPTLTELAIRAAAAPSNGTITLWDGSLTHFGIRVSPQGTKTFIVLLAPGRRQSIGRFPIITLAQARAKARTILAERTLGRHLPQSISWQTATQQFIDACRRKNRPGTVEQYENLLKRHFPFGTTRLGDISKRDIVQKLDKLDETPSQQAHALVGAKVFFNWAMRRGYVDQNPCLAIPGRKQPARSRVLTDDELKRVWQATEEIGGSFGAIVKLLLLTGQRRGEIAALRWEWIDEKTKTITLPSAITKNKRAHTFPFGDTAAAVLAAIPRPNDYVFPAARDRIKGSPATIFNGWGKAKVTFDKACPLPPWTLHDLRRTFATNLAGFGTPVHVTEKLLNHISGTTGGIVAIYQRHAYLDEMREAIEKWEARLASLLNS